MIDTMTPEQVLNELKEKRLPTYGTQAEKRDRLKKYYGISLTNKGKSGEPANASAVAHSSSVAEGLNSNQRKVTTNDNINQIKINREQRRLKMEEARRLKSERETNNQLQGIKVDVDF